MERNGVSKLDLKRINRAEILRIICCHGPISRIDLAKWLKLTRAAVTIISGEMIEQGILFERGELPATGGKVTRGRKKILLDICENYRFSFGVVLDQKGMHIGLATLKGQTLEHRLILVDGMSSEQIVELMYHQVQELLQRNCLTNAAILGIGLCLSDHLSAMQDKQSMQERLQMLRRMMEIRFALPVVVGSATEALLLAEQYFFPEKEKPDNVLLVRYDYDLDASILLEGKLYCGENRQPSWFSHVVVDTHGDYCECGRVGCCCTRMSIHGIIEKIKELYLQGKTPTLYRETEGDLSKVDFSLDNLEQLLAEDAVKRLYQEAFGYLTTAMDNVLTVLNPTRIVLFGFVFETMIDLEQLMKIMEREHRQPLKNRVVLSHITESQLHLAGNGLCVKQFFIDQGAL